MLGRAADKPIRIASKSIRCRPLLERILARDERFRGLLTFTLPETLWLAEQGFDDLVVAYPTADRAALRELAEGEARERISVMVDSTEQLDFIARAVGEGRPPVRVSIDVDAGWAPLGGRVRIGAKRSPLRTPEQGAALAREIVGRAAVELDGLMAYEAQIAGVGDRPPGKPLTGLALRAVQALSARELA